ncbi:MAG: ribonuclease E/G [Rhodobacteraceae bacterium]|jgi:Ribonuclease G/E|nr:ribonuclease E/G [Paracoccaceae bacterium]
MKGTALVLGHLGGRAAAAFLVDGQLDDLLVDPPDAAPPGPGAVFLGLPDRPMKGQGGAMLRLPDGMTGFLRGSATLRPGAGVVVQVTGHAEGGKALPLSDRVVLKGSLAIVTPGAPGVNVSRQLRDEAERDRLEAAGRAALGDRDHGVILRSAAEGAPDDAVAAEVAMLADLADRLAAEAGGRQAALLLDAPGAWDVALRDWPAADLVDDTEGAFGRHGVDDLLAALRSARVALGGGASMVIEPTTALVAVDVNTGSDTSPAAGLKANIAAARALPRQLRLRGLGGQVVVDMAPMAKKDRHILDQALKAAFRACPVETAVLGWTALGHVELQRKRDRRALDAGLLA